MSMITTGFMKRISVWCAIVHNSYLYSTIISRICFSITENSPDATILHSILWKNMEEDMLKWCTNVGACSSHPLLGHLYYISLHCWNFWTLVIKWRKISPRIHAFISSKGKGKEKILLSVFCIYTFIQWHRYLMSISYSVPDVLICRNILKS